MKAGGSSIDFNENWNLNSQKNQTRMDTVATCRLRHNSNALAATSSRCGSGLNWEMLGIWVFLVFCFGALVFATYVIWVKCAY